MIFYPCKAKEAKYHLQTGLGWMNLCKDNTDVRSVYLFQTMDVGSESLRVDARDIPLIFKKLFDPAD